MGGVSRTHYDKAVPSLPRSCAAKSLPELKQVVTSRRRGLLPAQVTFGDLDLRDTEG
jgi:hypothetical protein